MLKRTDVFVFDELGLLSAEYFVALDGILRVIMGNNLPWGGKLLISSGDAKQLPPVEGTIIWASVNMATMMEVFVFKADVRARDRNLQFLNDQCRRPLNQLECMVASTIVMRECQFVDDWNDVPDSAVRIVSTKAAEHKVVMEFLSKHSTVSSAAIDEVQNGMTWEPAGVRAKKQLNTKCYEYEECKLYLHAVVRMTYNDRTCPHPFSQGQLAVVFELPQPTDNLRDVRLKLRLAPTGTRQIQDASQIPADWPQVIVKPRTTPPVIVGTGLQMGRRTQLPVRLYIASTIHRIQGDTLPQVATQITDSSKEFRLWQRQQLAVLISRVSLCKDIIFVGDRVETRQAIERILLCSSKWDGIVDHYMATLDLSRQRQQPSIREINQSTHPFLPVYQELPAADCGYVYILVSLTYSDVFHVGHADNLKKALRNVNTGYGDAETRDTSLHPWGVFAFVSGFEMGDDAKPGQENRRQFAHLLKNVSVRLPSVEAVYTQCKVIADDWVKDGHKLVMVKCGRRSD
jgi:hypothetical protein